MASLWFFFVCFFVFLAQGLSLASSIHFSTYMEGWKSWGINIPHKQHSTSDWWEPGYLYPEVGHPEAQNVDWLLGFPRSHKTWVAHSGTCITDTSFTGSLFFFLPFFICSLSNWCLLGSPPKHIYVHACMLSHVQLFVTLWTVACRSPLSLEFSGQEYRSGLPFLPPGDLPSPGIKPMSLASPALQVNSLLLDHWGI